MNTKKVIAAVVLALFTVPAFASAYTYSASDYPRATETLVEGHTVFAVIQATLCIGDYGETTEYVASCSYPGDSDFDVSWDVRANVTVQRLGTAVAVLVRDRVKPYTPPPVAPECSNNRDVVATLFYENPGVLWFNDQFLVGDDLDVLEVDVDANVDVCQKEANIVFNDQDLVWRYPCGGWVFATQAGNPDPRSYIALFNYQESYRIEDPNGYVWIIDKFGLGPTIGTVVPYQDEMQDLGIDEDAPGYDYDDGADGDLRAVVGSYDGGQLGYYLAYYNLWTVPVMGLDTQDQGPTSGANCAPYADTASHDETPYGDGGDDTTRLYNAVLFFFFEDLVSDVAGVKVHGEGQADDGDTSGCQPTAGGYATEWECGAGRTDDMEGNSHPFNPNSADSGPAHIHPTARVDLYFSNVAANSPADADRVYAVYDTVGTAAPFHTHDPAMDFDDRVRIDPCADADSHSYSYEYEYNGGGTYTQTSYSESHEENFRYGEGEPNAPPGNGVNDNDCTGYYDGGYTGYPGEYY